ncbi:MAG: cytidine/deoxycytidylate deaminase family protein [Patescibacteria group bacterium]
MEYPTKQAFRPGWDHYFMTLAFMVAERSTCDRLRAGSVLVRDKRIVATGYNGSPPGMGHCDDIGHLMHEGHCIRTLHSEENTIMQAAKLGLSCEGATLYTTYSPCYHCLKKLIAVGVKRIVVGQVYRDTRIFDACNEVGVMLHIYEPNEKWQDYLSDLYKALPRKKIEDVKSSVTPDGKNYS